MKHRKGVFSVFLLSAVLSTMIALSGIMCLQDCFSIPCRFPVIFAAAVLFSLISSACMQIKRIWLPSLLVLLLSAGCGYYFRSQLWLQLNSAVYAITYSFSLCFSDFSPVGISGADCTLLLSMLTLPLAWVSAWVVGREGSCVPVLLCCTPILVSSLFIVDLAPVFWLVVLTAAIFILILSNHVRERNPAEGSVLAWWLFLPTAILIFALTFLWPPAAYVRAERTEELRLTVEEKLQVGTFYEQATHALPRWDSSLKQVNLSELGPKAMTGKEVLEYRSETRISYLRGLSLGVYDGSSWRAVSSDAYAEEGFSSDVMLPVRTDDGSLAEIRTLRSMPLLYTPYFSTQAPTGGLCVDDAYYKNEQKTTLYSVVYQSAHWQTTEHRLPDEYTDYVYKQYLQIPDALKQPLLELAQTMNLTADPNVIAAAVRGHAVYDLNTPAVPRGKDFVLYFLQESRQGYCVHFASATVMLLRTMGIPARYVTGYSVNTATDQWVSVTEDDAHAWAEYYADGIGWLPIDATPSAGTPQPSDPSADGTPQTGQTFAPVTEQTTPQQPTQQDATPSVPSSAPAVRPSAPQTSRLTVSPLLVIPGLIAAAIVTILLRRAFVMYRLQKRCRTGHPNNRMMAWWQQLIRLARTSQVSIEEELICLAEKARFSQHHVTQEELERMEQAVQQRIESLNASASPSKRIWYRYGKILY